MTGDLLRLAARMERERRPFALATVVRSERPTSGKPGNSALIDPDGTMHGWIGGSCTRSEVIRHALEALRLGEPRLLAFGADEERPADLVKVSMSCASGGKVEVHINPVLPAPVLVVVGDSPVALALLGLGRAMGYRTVAAASSGEEVAGLADECAEDLAARVGLLASRPPGTRLFAVVATMGREDERTLALLAGTGPDYLGVVASPRRMRSVRAVLSGLGIADDAIGRIRGPAGLDLGAEQPEEIAVSILAEIVGETRRAGGGGAAAVEAGGGERSGGGREADAPGRAPENVARGGAVSGDVGTAGTGASGCAPRNVARTDASGRGGEADAGPAGRADPGNPVGGAPGGADATSAAAWATDPVCGMTVPVAGSPSAVHAGRTVHFCCEGCRGLFESTPEVFASNPATGPA
ncbi:MAG: XdhC family protein [Gammaproteobacteria bacterium]|nr:XdhC family protein [Gammaproteobacteria bacterium]